MSKRLSSRALAVSAFAALAPCAQPAMADPFCDFLRQVLAARDNGFAALRGAAAVSKSGDKYYAGTLRPLPGAECTANPADFYGRAYYACNFNKYATLAEGEPLYYDLAGQMRRCFPATAVQEKLTQPKAGDAFPVEGRTISGIVDGYKVQLELTNKAAVLAWLAWQMAGRQGTIPNVYDMEIDVRAAR